DIREAKALQGQSLRLADQSWRGAGAEPGVRSTARVGWLAVLSGPGTGGGTSAAIMRFERDLFASGSQRDAQRCVAVAFLSAQLDRRCAGRCDRSEVNAGTQRDGCAGRNLARTFLAAAA